MGQSYLFDSELMLKVSAVYGERSTVAAMQNRLKITYEEHLKKCK
jgi:hypothetical protein